MLDVARDFLRYQDEAEDKSEHRVNEQRNQEAALQRIETPAPFGAAHGHDQRDKEQDGDEQCPDTPAEFRKMARLGGGKYFVRIGLMKGIDAFRALAIGTEVETES